MDIGIGLVGLAVVAIVCWIGFKLVKSLMKTMLFGLVVLLVIGGWLAYRYGFVGW